MSILYEEQCQIEQLNKQIFDNIIKTTKADDFIDYYINHTQKETCEYFGLRTKKQLTKVLTYFGYDFSTKKPSHFKGKKAVRSHESYVAGGKKSSETQIANWQNKSEEEKEAWSIKQSIAHLNSPTFKEKITESNRKYRYSLTKEEIDLQNKMRSESMKTWWDSLTREEKEATLAKRFVNGQSYNKKDSKPNLDFKYLLDKNNIAYERELCLDNKFFDFKIGNILVEIDPTFTHNSTYTPFEYTKPLNKRYHQQKSKIAHKYGYRCIHVFDWDSKDKIISLLARNNKTIYARKCQVKEISKQDAIDFISLNHLQNYARDNIRLGLFYADELVSVMTFDKPRYNKNYEWEIIRYCSSKNVIGGAEKLFNYFIIHYSAKSVISYCDLSKFSGTVYEKLGFTLLKQPVPSKHWYNIKTKEHYTDTLVRQQGFSRLIHHCDASQDNLKTNNNKELMISAGFVEIYDCGQAAYAWKKDSSEN